MWFFFFCGHVRKKKVLEIAVELISPCPFLFFFSCWIHVNVKMWKKVMNSYLPRRFTAQHISSVLFLFFQLPRTLLDYLLNGFLSKKEREISQYKPPPSLWIDNRIYWPCSPKEICSTVKEGTVGDILSKILAPLFWWERRTFRVKKKKKPTQKPAIFQLLLRWSQALYCKKALYSGCIQYSANYLGFSQDRSFVLFYFI